MVFLCSSVADRLHPSGRNLVDLGGGREPTWWLGSIVLLEAEDNGRKTLCGVKERAEAAGGLTWQEGMDDGKRMNRYPAGEQCGYRLTAASKPVVMEYPFEH